MPYERKDGKSTRSLFLLCWFAYFTSYIGRLNFPAVMTAIIAEGTLDAPQAGFVNMVYFLAYGTGQIVNGILGDHKRPHGMVLTGLSCSAVVNLAMGLSTVFGSFALFWALNGYFQSMIWPPIIRIFAERFSEKGKQKASIDIVSSMVAGTLASYLLSAFTMHYLSWSWAFFLAALALSAMALVWHLRYRKAEGKTTYARMQKSPQGTVRPLSSFPMYKSLLIIVVPVIIHGTIKDGVTSWVPTYIYEQFATSPSFSVMVTLLLPIMNLAGAYLAEAVNARRPDREIESASLFFAAGSFALLLLLLFGRYSILLTGLLLAVLTSTMMAVNTLFVNLVPLHFEAVGKVSTVSGLLNALAYGGSALASFSIGVMVAHLGWQATVAGWLGETLLAFFICLAAHNRSFGRPTQIDTSHD